MGEVEGGAHGGDDDFCVDLFTVSGEVAVVGERVEGGTWCSAVAGLGRAVCVWVRA